MSGPIPPVVPLKHEFYKSLDRFIAEAVNLYQSADTLVTASDFRGKDILAKRCAAFRAAWLGEEDET